MPIIELSKYCRDPQAERLEVLADDRAFPADLQAWSRQKEATILDLVQEGKEYRAILALGPQRRISRELAAADAPAAGTALPLLEEIDCTHLRSPLQIVELQKALMRHEKPGTLKVYTRDAQFMEDVEHWCRQSDAVLLQLNQSPDMIEAEIAVHLEAGSRADLQVLDEAVGEIDIRETAVQMPVLAVSRDSLPYLDEVSREPVPLGSLKPEQVLDYTGLRCPMPIVRLSQATRESSSKLYKVLADDAAFPQDLRAWCEQHEYEVLSIETVGRQTEALITKPQPGPKVHSPSLASITPAPAALTDPRIPPIPQPTNGSGMRLAAPASQWGATQPTARGRALQEHTIEESAEKAPLIPLPFSRMQKQPTVSAYEQALRDALTSSAPKESASKPNKRALLQHQPEDLAQIRTGEVLQVRSASSEQDFASSGKQVVKLDGSAGGDVAGGGFLDLTTNPKLPRLSLGEGANLTPGSRETTEFSLAQGPRAVQDLLPQGLESTPEVLPPEEPSHEAVSLDLTGLKCPLPIVRLAAQVRETPDATFTIKADDPAFPPDLRAWCHQSGMQIQSLETEGSVHTAVLGSPKAPASNPSHPLLDASLQVGSVVGTGMAQFEEMQSFSFWDTELPTKPVPQMMMKETRELDLRGLNAMACVDQLKKIPDDSTYVYRVLIDPTISMDNFQMLCELNYFSCIAVDPGETFGEIWLQRALSGL